MFQVGLNLDLPQVDLFFILDLFITLKRSEKVISSDEVARSSASDVSRERSFQRRNQQAREELLERAFRKSRLNCHPRLNSGRSVSIKVNKIRMKFSRNTHGARMLPQCFPVSHTGNIVSSVSFCLQDAIYAYATRQGISTKIRACEHLQTFCEHEQASTHLIFASHSSKGQILRALSNWMGPFDTPTSN